MKIQKGLLLFILATFTAIYLCFLFVLPNSIDISGYAPQLSKLVQENTGLELKLSGIKVKTGWNLSAGADIEKADLFYPEGKKFGQINNLEVKLSLIPLLYKNFKLDSISADKVLINAELDDKGEFLLKKYLTKKTNSQKDSNLKFSEKMPDIKVSKYRISLLQKNKNFTFKGENFYIDDFILNKKAKVSTLGNIIIDGSKKISYKINLDSNAIFKDNGEKFDLVKNLKELDKYKISADLNADLKLRQKNDDIDLNGSVFLHNLTFSIGEKKFPKSNLDMKFKGDKAKIISNIYTDSNSHLFANGLLKTGKKKSIDLSVTSDRINLQDLVLITKTMSKTLGLKNLDGYNAKGLMKANFSIQSDFKKIKSNGYLKIKDASLDNKLYKVSLNGINADIDFSQNSLKIKKATAKLNNQPIAINGEINNKAVANIKISAENLNLKSLIATTGNLKLIKENDIAGLVNIDASLVGKIDKAKPNINLLVQNIKIFNKKTNTHIKLDKILYKTELKKHENEKIYIYNLTANSSAPVKISLKKLDLTKKKDEIVISETPLYLNNIKTNLSGKISSINTSVKLNNIQISTTKLISSQIDSIPGSTILAQGSLKLNGPISSPQILGSFDIPLIKNPKTLTTIKGTTLKLTNDAIWLNCPQIQIANTFAKINGTIKNDFSNGIVFKYLDFYSDNVDLNTLTAAFTDTKHSKTPLSISVLNGKNHTGNFKVGRIVSSNITSNLQIKNNILHLYNLKADAYNGKIAGEIEYDLTHFKTKLNLQGRGLSANPAIIALTGRNDDINGNLDFDTNVSFSSGYKNNLLKSLKGYTHFIITNGRMGILGKFEHLLYAQNILSNSVFKATLNVMIKAITVKDTGVYRYIKGKINFSNGWANITSVKTSGPSMSLYMTGRYYMPDNMASITILGRISDDVVRILGPIGEFSMDKAISYIPKLGEITAFFASQFTTNPNYENISEIPPLSLQTEFKTKEFKVIISGDIQKQSSVKSFKWIASPKVAKSDAEIFKPTTTHQPPASIQYKAPQTSVPDFVKNLPDLKN